MTRFTIYVGEEDETLVITVQRET